MFLEKLIDNNPKLVEASFKLFYENEILPDTYVLDLDSIIENASLIKQEANKYRIDLYFMLKQIGRNPLVAKQLMEIGYTGAVCVDYKEALCMIENNIHIANVGHLVQIPMAVLDKIIFNKPDYVTVYSYDKILEINEVCKKSVVLFRDLFVRFLSSKYHKS